MLQLLRFILLIAVLAGIGVGIYYWIGDRKGANEVRQPGGVAGEPTQP